jgi:hypothetical protein
MFGTGSFKLLYKFVTWRHRYCHHQNFLPILFAFSSQDSQKKNAFFENKLGNGNVVEKDCQNLQNLDAP